MALIAKWNHLNPNLFEKQYKDHLSDYHAWDQKPHADEWLLFEKNIGTHLSLDETSISNGELYTLLTSKAGKGGKGTLVAMAQGTRVEDIAEVFEKISLKKRLEVQEVTLDFSSSMEQAARRAFPHARLTTDRFHVQRLVSEALQEMRISLRWKTLEEENKAIKEAKRTGKPYLPHIYTNGDTKKQLLARSRYLLFKPKSQWSSSQEHRAAILFSLFPELRHAYSLTMCFSGIYTTSKTKPEALSRLNAWFTKVNKTSFSSFHTVSIYLQNHLDTILNYFPDRSTNASAESFNAKLKGFRALLRGVNDKKFFLFRVSELYA